jgi:hypothetical protein
MSNFRSRPLAGVLLTNWASIAGTSMGALPGGTLATGMPAAEIERSHSPVIVGPKKSGRPAPIRNCDI